jgi:hypothetical protein
MIGYSNILQIDNIMDNAAFKMMLLSIRSDSNNNNLSLPSQSNVSTKEQPKSYDNNKIIIIIIIKIKTTSYNNKIPL